MVNELKNRILELAAKTVLVTSQVTLEVKEQRQATCDGCKFKDEDNRCKICKCFLAVKTWSAENLNIKKGRYEITHCPIGLWGDLETANHYREIDGLEPIKSA